MEPSITFINLGEMKKMQVIDSFKVKRGHLNAFDIHCTKNEVFHYGSLQQM